MTRRLQQHSGLEVTQNSGTAAKRAARGRCLQAALAGCPSPRIVFRLSYNGRRSRCRDGVRGHAPSSSSSGRCSQAGLLHAKSCSSLERRARSCKLLLSAPLMRKLQVPPVDRSCGLQLCGGTASHGSEAAGKLMHRRLCVGSCMEAASLQAALGQQAHVAIPGYLIQV